MNSAVLFATLCFHNSGWSHAQAIGPCTATKSCISTNPVITADRGICVPMPGGASQCWDACDTSHTVQEYAGTNLDPDERPAIAMMVQAARTVQGKCPGADWKHNIQCNPGERCTAVTLNRGLCATTGGVHQCLDMCDTSIPITSYSGGAAEKAGNSMLVQAVRANHDPQGLTTCPGATVWLWLWFPILLCCCIGCIFGWYTVYQRWRRINKRSSVMNKQDQFLDDYPVDDYQKDVYDVDNTGPAQDMGGQDYMPVSYQEMERQRDMEDPMPVMPPVEETQQLAPPPVLPARESYPQPAPTQYAPTGGATFGAPFAPQGMPIAAPSTFYNSHQLNPMASVYSAGIQQPGFMPGVGMPGTLSYRVG